MQNRTWAAIVCVINCLFIPGFHPLARGHQGELEEAFEVVRNLVNEKGEFAKFIEILVINYRVNM